MTTRGTKSEEKGDCSQSNFHFFLHFFLINLLTLYRLKLIFVTIKSAVLHAKLYRVPQQIMLDDTSYELVKIHLKRLASPLHLVNNYPPLSPTCMKVNYWISVYHTTWITSGPKITLFFVKCSGMLKCHKPRNPYLSHITL